ncbi:hypothetical protein KOAAANKH_01556 [Brevundimonas sp. NIBR10]|uniref:DUF1176 domain-containing protein n=1 Tax=Brevundimonas sp. NIBR10 TaxID=3015997 RepID=UPI0022F18295|nr:DUF1176 domain-containing protein [Brevundimonas sp. NIBR10]WGM46683.1 hypothetical protein KOAAANKH_01556 [Brevundimonas sp. NIBR10]
MNRWTMAAATVLLAACGNGEARTAGEPGASSTAATQAAIVKSESRQFRDWYAVCDNGNACVAYTGGVAAWVRVGIDAGPQARPTIHFGLWPDGGEENLGAPISLVIDGRRHATTPGPDDTSSAVIPARDVRAVLAELAAARTISLVSGDQTAELPAAGASASLLWFDERQGRLDTTTALIRRGQRAASAVPAAPDLPVITAAPAVSQTGFTTALDPINTDDEDDNAVPPAALEAVPAVRQCRENTAFNDYLRKAVTASRLNATTELWGIPCDSGAYNVSYAYFLAGAGGADPRPVSFPDADGKAMQGADGTEDWLINPAYDPATRTLSAFAKARGLGDCGVSQTWTWTGRAFVLSREQVMSDCFGMVSDFWPTTFRSR